MDAAEHWLKIRYLERHLPLGVPVEAPIERCKRCNCTAEAHPVRQYQQPGDPEYTPACAAMIEPYWDGTPWPATFGDYVDGQPVHRADEGAGYCFQCLYCRHYAALDSDWGLCQNAGGQYYAPVFKHPVMEHWTCVNYEHAIDDDDEDDIADEVHGG